MIPNVEFFFPGDNRGVLLIHGLTGTPQEMRILGKGLNNRGFTTRGVQLAGHCGSVDDLLATGWTDWYRSVETAAREMRGSVEHLFVAGLSMGALLALRLAEEHPDWVDGVGVLGATFRYDGWSLPALNRLSFLLPMLKRLGIGRDRMFMEQPPYGLRDENLRRKISEAMASGDSTAAGLPGNPWHSLAELYLMSRRVRRDLRRVVAPCLIAHATEDDIASSRNAELVARRVSGPTEMLWLDDSYHMITIDRERRRLIEGVADFFARVAAAGFATERAA
ncbi:alpha/beta hydrolase [Salinisphaera hydrothermalis]|uniref:alpha/beta hydrolase n=1 Tax=Salinisphaera hydrothermalis TaxID=563188 RepID=UPI00334033BC